MGADFDYISEFHNGRLADAYKYMGAHICGDETVFRVWAPTAKAVSIVGDFNDWDKKAAPMKK